MASTVPALCHEDDVSEDSGTARRCAVCISVPDSSGRTARAVLVSPACTWLHESASAWRGSGRLIVDGIERANPELAGLREQLFVIRDQELLHPNALRRKTVLCLRHRCFAMPKETF